MSNVLSGRQLATLHAFVALTEPSDPIEREDMREALFSTDEYHQRVASLGLPINELLKAIYEFIQSHCDDSSGLAHCISKFPEDPSYRFSAGFVFHYMAQEPDPKNWFGSLESEILFFLEDFPPNSNELFSDHLDEIIRPLNDRAVAENIVSKFFELAESGPKNSKGQTFCQLLEADGLLPAVQ